MAITSMQSEDDGWKILTLVQTGNKLRENSNLYSFKDESYFWQTSGEHIQIDTKFEGF